MDAGVKRELDTGEYAAVNPETGEMSAVDPDTGEHGAGSRRWARAGAQRGPTASATCSRPR